MQAGRGSRGGRRCSDIAGFIDQRSDQLLNFQSSDANVGVFATNDGHIECTKKSEVCKPPGWLPSEFAWFSYRKRAIYMNELSTQWRDQIIEDYPEALIRLATVRGDSTHYLLFAWVELFPFDMAVPSSWNAGKKPWAIPGFSDWSCGFSVRKVATADALDWYESAGIGKIEFVNSASVQVVKLQAEPIYEEFCVGVEAPFVFRWHDGPRIHRYIPMDEIPLNVRKLGSSAAFRDWLKVNLGFNPFQYDEWLGGLALVAPDPVCSSVDVFPSEKGKDGSEFLTVYATPRRSTERGVSDLSTLSVIVAERRVNGWSSVHEMKLEPDGYCTICHKKKWSEAGHAVVCARRGLLRFVEPLSWIEQIGIGMNLVNGHRQVQVPSGGRRKPGNTYSVAHQVKGSDIVVGEAMSDKARMRLIGLRERARLRVERSNVAQRMFGVTSISPSPQEIEARRKEAEDFVAKLVAGARKCIIFVDPYFGPREMRQFALRNSHENVVIKILTGQMALLGQMPDAPAGTKIGEIFVKDVDFLAHTHGVQSPQVRVMPGGDDAVIHDRYLIIDDVVWHCGPSFNELGQRVGVMVLLPESLSIRRIVSRVWCRSTPLPEYWNSIKKRKRKSLICRIMTGGLIKWDMPLRLWRGVKK